MGKRPWKKSTGQLQILNKLVEHEHPIRRRKIAVWINILEEFGVTNLLQSAEEGKRDWRAIALERIRKQRGERQDRIRGKGEKRLELAADERAAHERAKRGKARGLGDKHDKLTKAEKACNVRRMLAAMEPGREYWLGEMRSRYGIAPLQIMGHGRSLRPPRSWFVFRDGKIMLTTDGLQARSALRALE